MELTMLFISALGFTSVLIMETSSILPPSCFSNIYCHGRLLHTIQMAPMFSDSKTFVDMKMKQNSTQTLSVFNNLMKETGDNPCVEDLKQFLEENFEPEGSEFEDWIPPDWYPAPKFLDSIKDRKLRDWAELLHGLWKKLGRKLKQEVIINPHLYSIIPVPYPVIVPGGRFREFYYWDSYWIIRGLLLSEMYDTVKGMLGNFMSIIDTHGFIPNGGRLYYLQRSQPPLLIPMVDSYLETTKDYDFLKKNIHFLEAEFNFWMKNHSVVLTSREGKKFTLARYMDSSSGPRPESYREDTLTAMYMEDEEAKNNFYSQLKTAAESGWDFSTRWFIPKGNSKGNLTSINIKSIIPVDLNSILHWNAKLLAKFYRILKDPVSAEKYEKVASKWLEAINSVLWHPEVGIWLDYDMLNNVKRDYFYPSNLAPLWTKSYYIDMENDYVDGVVRYLKKSKVLLNLGGIPTSLVHSGEQWDYPNAWPPLQYIIIKGLLGTGHTEAMEIAQTMIERWVRTNYKAFQETNAMFEKYDATVVGGHGGGGEYEVQLGFGWSNAVIMELLSEHGELLTAHKLLDYDNYTMAEGEGVSKNSAMVGQIVPLLTLMLAFGVTLTAGCIGAIVYAKRHSITPRPDKSKYMKIPGSSNLKIGCEPGWSFIETQSIVVPSLNCDR